MPLDKIALILVAVGACIWALALLTGLLATLPFGLPVLIVLGVAAYLLIRVIRDRLGNTEDDYYEKNIHQ